MGIAWSEFKGLHRMFLPRAIVLLLLAIFLFWLFPKINIPDKWNTIPIAIVTTVLIGWLFQAPAYKRFLQEAATDVIQNKKFLETLNKGSLDRMLTKIHQVYYELPDELEKGNLYSFVKEHLLRHLSDPYEQNLVIDYNLVNKGDYVEITFRKEFAIETLSEQTVEKEKEIGLYITRVPGQSNEFHFPFEKFHLKIKGQNTGFPEHAKRIEAKDDVLAFRYLQKYTVSKNSPFTIEFSIVGNEFKHEMLVHQLFKLPTKGFYLRITVHEFGECDFDMKFSGPVQPDPEQVKITNGRVFELKYDGWMIPGNTVTVTYKPKGGTLGSGLKN